MLEVDHDLSGGSVRVGLTEEQHLPPPKPVPVVNDGAREEQHLPPPQPVPGVRDGAREDQHLPPLQPMPGVHNGVREEQHLPPLQPVPGVNEGQHLHLPLLQPVPGDALGDVHLARASADIVHQTSLLENLKEMGKDSCKNKYSGKTTLHHNFPFFF